MKYLLLGSTMSLCIYMALKGNMLIGLILIGILAFSLLAVFLTKSELAGESLKNRRVQFKIRVFLLAAIITVAAMGVFFGFALLGAAKGILMFIVIVSAVGYSLAGFVFDI